MNGPERSKLEQNKNKTKKKTKKKERKKKEEETFLTMGDAGAAIL